MRKAWICCCLLTGLGLAGYAELSPDPPLARARITNPPPGKLIGDRRVASVMQHSSQALSAHAYDYRRSIHTRFNPQKKLIDLEMHGTVWVRELELVEEWKEAKGATRAFLLQFSLASPTAPGTVRASHLNFVALTGDKLEVKSLRSEKTRSADDQAQDRAQEQDEINALKDFASLYFYGSNQDTAGFYAYHLNQQGKRIEKIKEKYLAQPSLSAELLPKILNSRCEGEIADDQLLLTLRGTERTELKLGQGNLLTTDAKFRIQEKAWVNAPFGPTQDFKNLQTATLRASSTARGRAFDSHEWKARLQTLNQLSPAERLRFFHDLSADLAQNQQNISQFKSEIESRAQQLGVLQFGIGVLANLSGEESQACLRNWYSEYPTEAHTVLNAFALSGKPVTPETRLFLIAESQNRENLGLAENAALALGSSLRVQSDVASEARLAQIYASAQTSAAREQAIEAIGNSGSAKLVNALIPSLTSINAAEKNRALFALRFVSPEIASPYFHAAFVDNPVLQKTALRAIAYQSDLTLYADIVAQCARLDLPECANLHRR